MIRALLSLAAVLLAAPSVRADGAGPFPIPFRKFVRVTHRIETQQDFPDYVFILHLKGGEYDQTKGSFSEFEEFTYVNLTPSNPIVLDLVSRPEKVTHKSRRDERALLVAVEWRRDWPRPPAAKLMEGLGTIPAHFVGERDFTGAESVWTFNGADVTRTYRVEQHKVESKLTLVLVHTTESSWPCVTILLFPLAVFLGGLWLVRRVRRRRIPRATPVT